jgi:FkbM family methyltransferase
MSLTSYAENFEDVLLWRALRHVEQGWYVDVGAGHPQQFSVTQAFYERGWCGLNIEPAASLQSALRAARPADVTLPVAAGAGAGYATLYEVPDSLYSSADMSRARAAAESIGKGAELLRREIEVHPLNDLLAAHAPADIHFLKIDAAGTEESVLEGLDLQRFRPWIIVVDTRSGAAWESALLGSRYKLAHDDGMNRYYAAAEHPALLDLLRLPPNPADDFVLCEDHPYSHPLNEWRDRVAAAEEVKTWAMAHVQEWKDKNNLLIDAQQRAARAEAEVASLQPRLANAEYTISVIKPRMEQAEGTLNAVYASQSWRVTKPLRAGKVYAGKAARFARRAASRIASQSKRLLVRAVKGAALRLVRFVQSRPRLAFFARRQISRFPWMVQALRTVVLRMQANNQAAAEATPANMADLPAAARQVFDDLRRARNQ